MKQVRSEWQDVVMVCRKCTRRAGGGFGPKGRTPLAKLLRRLGLADRRRKAARGVVEVGCLKLCPKNAVVAVTARHPGRWAVIPAGAERDAIVAALGLADPAPANDTGDTAVITASC